jgi:N-acetyl-gamma-glutamyl-phosphate reductase
MPHAPSISTHVHASAPGSGIPQNPPSGEGWGPSRPIRVAVVGAAGLAGGELLEHLVDHSGVTIVGLFGSERIEPGAEPTVDALHPRLAGLVHGPVRRGDVDAIAACRPDAIMLAVPHGASATLVPELLAATDAVILDLSGTFRLGSTELAQQHYGVSIDPGLAATAVYGLVELARGPITDSAAAPRLIAVPGCYPTASILPLRPLADGGWLTGGRVAITAASGVSGAGRGANERTSFCNVSFQPYGVGTHRHAPEIELHAAAPVSFVPHLAAWDRGILATIHATVVPGTTAEDVRRVWRERLASPFVRVLPDGAWPAVGDVRGTNRCDLGVYVEPDGTAVLVSAIDNLLKGAAGQAIQCMNLRFGLDETAGLPGAMRPAPAAASAVNEAVSS